MLPFEIIIGSLYNYMSAYSYKGCFIRSYINFPTMIKTFTMVGTKEPVINSSSIMQNANS